MSTRPILPDERPDIVRLERPLSIVTSEELGVREPGAFLISAGKRRSVSAVMASAGEFDGELAFRQLDDWRTRAEDVFRWVEESLALEPTTAPAPESDPPRPALYWLSYVALVALGTAALLLVPKDIVVPLAGFLFLFSIARLNELARYRGGTLASCAGLFGIVIATPFAFLYGLEGVLGSALASFLIVSIAYLAAERIRREDRESFGPVEYVLREGEATRYRPELCLAGDVLCVAIRCESVKGHLMRHVLVPVQGATREDAATAARWAQDYDIALREDETSAADELQRVQALERSRRTLPDP